MAGYIGKISALVTASTADLERKLSGTKGTVQAFGRSLSSTINAASKSAQSSLAGIFTPLQKIERALQAGQGRLNLVDSGSANRIRQIVSVAEGINKPAASLQKAFSQLSAEVQSNFKPALDRVQGQVLLLNRGLEQTGSVGERSFRLVERGIASATQAASRLSEAQRLAQSSLTGKELRFVAPAVSGALQAGANARNAAGALSPELLENGRIGRLVSQVSRYSDLLVRAQAQVEAAQLSPNVDTKKLERAQQLVDGFTKKLNQSARNLAGEAGGDAESEAAIRDRVRRDRETADAIRKRRMAVVLAGGDSTFAGTRAVDIFGAAPGSVTARSSGIESNIRSLQSQIEALPASVQSKLIPALNRARTAYAAIGDAPTERELATAAKYAQELEQQLKRAQAAAQFGGTFGQFLDDSAVNRYDAKLQSVRSQLLALGVTAGGPVASAFDQLSLALQEAGAAGALGTDETRKKIDALIGNVAQALVATKQLNAEQAKAFVANVAQAGVRGGDVGRGGFDKFTLGAQQAAFAIDDFLSATGGFEQKLRAVSNNITQLGFLVGGLKGLFIGLGIIVVGQAVLAISKYINNGVEAEDRTKALNEALSKQKSLVEDLAQAFRSLGDALSGRALSEPAKRAREFSRSLEEVQIKQRQLAASRAAELDPVVLGEKFQQARLQKELDNSDSPGQRVALARQLRESRERERRRVAEIVNAPAPGAAEAFAAIQAAVGSQTGGVLRDSRGNYRNRAGRDEARRAIVDQYRADFAAAGTVAELKTVIERRLAERQSVAAVSLTDLPQLVRRGLSIPEVRAARDEQKALQNILNRLNVDSAINDTARNIVRASNAAAIDIESAQNAVAGAIRKGAPGAAALQSQLDEAGRQLADANKRLERAAAEIDPVTGLTLTPEERKSRVKAAGAEVAAVEGRLADLQRRAREVALSRTIGGERGTAALSLLQDPRFANETNRRADLERAIYDEQQAMDRLNAAIEKGDAAARARAEADLKAAQRTTELAAAAAEAAVAVGRAFERLNRQAENVVSGRERIADEAQRRVAEFDQREAERRGTTRERVVAERDQAEQDLIRGRQAAQQAQNRLDQERLRADSDPRIVALNAEAERLREQQQIADEKARLTGQQDVNQRARADRLAAIEAERTAIVSNRPGVRAAQEELDRQQQAVAAAERRRAEIERGVDLAVTPAQQAGRELVDGLLALRAARADNRIGQPAFDEATRRLTRDTLRQQAPAIFALSDAVQNSVLMGPSRAALTATDITTAEGARELTRLIRGDDPSRNQNLVELRRQTQALQEVVRILRDAGVPIANN